MNGNKTLTDDELNEVTGGKNSTGDVKDNKVYFQFPFPFTSMSGFYSCEEVETLATNFGAYKEQIKSALTPDMISAVNKLYQINNKAIPTVVSDFFS